MTTEHKSNKIEDSTLNFVPIIAMVVSAFLVIFVVIFSIFLPNKNLEKQAKERVENEIKFDGFTWKKAGKINGHDVIKRKTAFDIPVYIVMP